MSDNTHTWLDDATITALLARHEAGATSYALEAIALRAEWSDPVSIPPLRAVALAPFGGDVPLDVLGCFLDLLTEPKAGVTPSDAHTARELATLVACYASASNNFAIAHELKVHPRATALVVATLDALATQPVLAPERRALVARFVGDLLDGSPQLREATLAALAGWVASDAGRSTLAALHAHVDDVTRARIPRLENEQ